MLSDQSNVIDGWTRSPLTGVLSCSVGPWGERQRLFQKRAGGRFYCSVYLTDGRRRVRSLGTTESGGTPLMASHRKFSELRERMTSARRTRNRLTTKAMLAEMPLQELRRARELSQETL